MGGGLQLQSVVGCRITCGKKYIFLKNPCLFTAVIWHACTSSLNTLNITLLFRLQLPLFLLEFVACRQMYTHSFKLYFCKNTRVIGLHL